MIVKRVMLRWENEVRGWSERIGGDRGRQERELVERRVSGLEEKSERG